MSPSSSGPDDRAGVEHVEHRARLRVALGEQQEVEGQVSRGSAIRLAWVQPSHQPAVGVTSPARNRVAPRRE